MSRQHSLRQQLADERGSLYVEYVLFYTAVAIMISIVMAVITERRYQLGDAMADTLEVLIGSFDEPVAGQANFGRGFYPGTKLMPQPGEVAVSRLHIGPFGTKQPLSWQSFTRLPIGGAVRPAAGVRVGVDERGRTVYYRSLGRTRLVLDPVTAEWRLAVPGDGEQAIDRTTAQQLGFVAVDWGEWLQLSDVSLGVPGVLDGTGWPARLVAILGALGLGVVARRTARRWPWRGGRVRLSWIV